IILQGKYKVHLFKNIYTSINFSGGKLHGATEVKAMLRHCDEEERLKRTHKNKQIDKTLTHKNMNLTKLTYKQACDRYTNRIKQLDETTNTNRRKDRVTCFGLSIPAPAGLSEEQERDFFRSTCSILQDYYGGKNIVGCYAHFDEKHQYLDSVTKELTTSRAHLHAYIIPEYHGSLNGKWFSSRKNMNTLNKKLDELCKERYNVKFMTNSKDYKDLSVEELKQLSNEAVTQQKQQLKELHKERNKVKAESEAYRTLAEGYKENIIQLSEIAEQVSNPLSDMAKTQQAQMINDILTNTLELAKSKPDRLKSIHKVIESFVTPERTTNRAFGEFER
ncbi:MAG: plasmid recombination protein, partial [Eubacteriales bacterium]|nr:plasmid recombination protein [Eubacteriales bacterium]